MFYPLKFYPIYKERIWGGDNLKKLFKREITSDKTGESWDVACHPNGNSTISNGTFQGKTLKDLIKEYGRKIIGNKLEDKDVSKFPLLIKLLDANDVLSVQVHPDDFYANKNENGELGKCEMWYVISAKPGAKIVYGIKEGITKENFKEAIKKGELEKCLNFMDAYPGDVFDVPSGMVHALGAGVVVAEIQQNSDTVYRVYDWNRVGLNGKPRELHIDKALDVIDFTGKLIPTKTKGLRINDVTYFVANKYFAVQMIEIRDEYSDIASGDKFYIYTAVSGNGVIDYDKGEETFLAGESILIPAYMGNYSIKGSNLRVLKSYVPDLEQDIIKPLRNSGYSNDEISKVVKKIS